MSIVLEFGRRKGKITNAMTDFRKTRLIRIACAPGDFPRDGRPQVCFAGRSNVGKSSLLNTLVGLPTLARTSKTPGRTREIHFYLVADRFYFVDLPGYGYAKVSHSMRRQWAQLVESYLTNNEPLRLMVAILDARHDPTESDLDLMDWIESLAIPSVVVLTKSDKVSASVAARQYRRTSDILSRRIEASVGAALQRRAEPILFSARTGAGRAELVRVILDSVKDPPQSHKGTMALALSLLPWCLCGLFL
ncbi:YihA family ribosome biogenesis GTP-binding protein [Candidatus Sumerlaeota bacterium]|nr:YihA family ribosome biogenesis GTP-binding protein [Candidatus Sumerlaeota bacterium]